MTEGVAGLVWSYSLAAVGIAGIILAGRRNAWGWAIGLGAQVLWIIYAVVTSQYGFIVSALAYAIVYYRNWSTWIRENKQARKLAAIQHVGSSPVGPLTRAAAREIANRHREKK